MGILNWTRLGTPASNRHTTAFGNFRFLSEVTAQNFLSPTEEITSKAPWDYNTFITIKTAPLDEGGAIGKKIVLDQVHVIFENLWTVDPTLVIYPFPGKIQHSKHVMPYKRKHTQVPQLKRYRKIATLPELKRYTDRVLVYSTKCSFINFFSRSQHANRPINELGCWVPGGERSNADHH